ncbi:hypothetical protein AKK86_04370 [Idiomarina sp. FenBw--71]|nr:hypothetical protein [Idiomarina sp. FeN1]NCU57002.1 hypothetical protein [Idiomarina sp. FenA--70]NCU59711.1 hypothetical protein [Idiomarina sp. FenBw--71]
MVPLVAGFLIGYGILGRKNYWRNCHE